jgi:hypothetical protein
MIKGTFDDFTSLNGITQESNVGGMLTDIKLCPAEWIQDIVHANGVLTDIVLTAAGYWINIEAADNSVQWSCTKQESTNGSFFAHSISFEKAKLTDVLTRFLTQYAAVPMVAFGIDRNGFGHLIGTKDEYLNLRVVLSTGRKTAKNLAVFESSGLMSSAGYIIAADILPTLFPEFGTAFSSDFTS